MSRRLASLCLAAAALAACGPPLQSADEVAAVLAQSAVPAPAARQGSTQNGLTAGLTAGIDPLPLPVFTVPGLAGGEAELDFNVVAAALGLFGEGLLFNVHYRDYSHDGLIRLNGDFAVLANFAYVPASDLEPAFDLKLTVAGRGFVDGLYDDSLYARVSLTTRVAELEAPAESIRFFLDGYVETDAQRFEWAHQDVTVFWNRFLEANP